MYETINTRVSLQYEFIPTKDEKGDTHWRVDQVVTVDGVSKRDWMGIFDTLEHARFTMQNTRANYSHLGDRLADVLIANF